MRATRFPLRAFPLRENALQPVQGKVSERTLRSSERFYFALRALKRQPMPGCLAAWLPGSLAAWLPGCLAALRYSNVILVYHAIVASYRVIMYSATLVFSIVICGRHKSTTTTTTTTATTTKHNHNNNDNTSNHTNATNTTMTSALAALPAAPFGRPGIPPGGYTSLSLSLSLYLSLSLSIYMCIYIYISMCVYIYIYMLYILYV